MISQNPSESNSGKNDPDSVRCFVTDDDGEPLMATFEVSKSDEGIVLTYLSRGGSKGANNYQNGDYAPGLDLVLERLAKHGAVLLGAWLDTERTRKLGLPAEARLLETAHQYPVQLNSVSDLVSFRKQLCAAQRPIGREPGAKGTGNNTKRFQMLLEGVTAPISELADKLSGPPETTADHIVSAAIKPGRMSTRQGYGLSYKERRLVELRAMEVAHDYLKEKWDHVEDVSGRSSFDFLCRSGEQKLYVEVKGSTGAAFTVMLTRNEVLHMQAHFPATALLVVSGIKLEMGGQSDYAATGGELHVVHPWRIEASDLTPVAYEYSVPKV